MSPPAAIAGLGDARPIAPLEFSRAWLGKVDAVRRKRAELMANGQLDGVTPAVLASEGAALTGTLRVPVVPVVYADGDAPFDVDLLQQRLFGKSVADTLSYSDYYHEISGGLLTVTGTVTPWLRLSHDARYYLPEGQYGWASFGKTAELRVEALKAADHDVDFAQYDNDGPDGVPNSGDDDGYVDFVAIVYAVPCPSSSHEGAIWPHRAAMAPLETNDVSASGGHIKIADYVILPAVDPTTCGPMHIGVLAHETGHALGLPDLYDYDGSSQGIGSWGLMGTGSHTTRFSPAHMSAWEKEQLGWVREIWLRPGMAFNEPPIERVPLIYRYDLPDQSGQYMLFENRQRIRSDKYLPGHGMLAWRVDPERAELGAWNTDERHPAVALMEADGSDDLSTVGRAEASEPFPGPMAERVLRPFDVQSLRLSWISENHGNIQATPFVGYTTPSLVPERTSINMTALVGQKPERHSLLVHHEGGATAWSAQTSAQWITLHETYDSLSIAADPLGLPPGQYADTIHIMNARGEQTAKVVVGLNVVVPGVPEIIATGLTWTWGLAARSGMLLQASYGWDALGLHPRPRVLQLWDGVTHPSTFARIPADALYSPVIADNNTSYVIARARGANYVYRLDASGNAEVVASNVGDGPAYGAALMPNGDLIVAEWSGKLHRVTPDGVISDYGKLNAHLYQIATDRDGNIFAATYEGSVIMMTPTGASALVTTGFEPGKLVAIAATPAGDLYVSERGDHGRIIRIARDGTHETLLQRRGAQFYGIAVDDRFLYAVDLKNRELLRIPRDGLPVTPTFAAGMLP